MIVDATSLICLQELSAIDILLRATKLMDITVIIPDSVWNEVKRDPLDREIADTLRTCKVKRVAAKRSEFERLRNRYPRQGKGELEAICLAKDNSLRNCVVLLDDRGARKIANDFGIEHHGLLWFVEQCCKNKALEVSEALDILNRITDTDFRVSDELIAKTKAAIQDLSRSRNP